MAGFDDFNTALAMRDTIRKMVESEVQRQRPRYQYATVTAIDRVSRKCTVQFPGEAGTVVVNMGALQPNTVGQVVRIDGLAGDRFVSDVIGDPYDPLAIAVSTATSTNATQDTRLTAVESKNTTQDSRLTTVESTNTTQNSRLTTVEGRLGTDQSITTGFTMVSGWSDNGCAAFITNSTCHVFIRATRTGAAMNFSTTGDIGDTGVVMAPAAARDSYLIAGRGNVTSSSGNYGFDFRVYPGADYFYVTSGLPSKSIATSDYIFADYSFLI